MPAPIMPAPRMPSFLTLLSAGPLGRDWPFLMALSWCHKVPIMFLLVCETTQAAK